MTGNYDIDGMRMRLDEALKAAGISGNAASANAGFSKGYVHSIIAGNADPGTKKLAELCQKNGISFSYVVFGFDMSPETEALVRAFEADPARRDSILSLLKS